MTNRAQSQAGDHCYHLGVRKSSRHFWLSTSVRSSVRTWIRLTGSVFFFVHFRVLIIYSPLLCAIIGSIATKRTKKIGVILTAFLPAFSLSPVTALNTTDAESHLRNEQIICVNNIPPLTSSLSGTIDATPKSSWSKQHWSPRSMILLSFNSIQKYCPVLFTPSIATPCGPTAIYIFADIVLNKRAFALLSDRKLAAVQNQFSRG